MRPLIQFGAKKIPESEMSREMVIDSETSTTRKLVNLRFQDDSYSG